MDNDSCKHLHLLKSENHILVKNENDPWCHKIPFSKLLLSQKSKVSF